MRHVMTFHVDAKGKRTEHFGPDTPEKTQRAYFNNSKVGRLPKGVVRVELWERFRQTTGIESLAQQVPPVKSEFD